MKNILIILFTVLTLNASTKDLVDHTALATMMIYDAKYDKAKKELDLVDKNSTAFDAANYYTLVGVLNSKINKHHEAIDGYLNAIKATKTKKFLPPKAATLKKYLFSIASNNADDNTTLKFDEQQKKDEKLSELYMQLTQEYYILKDYHNSVISLEKAGEKGKSRAALFTLRAECYFKQKKFAEAFESLNEGIKKFPEDSKLLKQKFYYFADLKLYQAAIENSKIYIQKVGASAKEYITLAQILIGANQIDSAIELLEESKLIFPNDAKISVLLGHIYLKKSMPHTTAYLFEVGSYYDKSYLKDAVEMTRRSGDTLHALYLNTQNTDKIEKLKQKIAIYLNAQEYRKIIGLSKALNRYKMLDDDNLRYALAYSYYMAGDYKNSEEQLKYISDNELFSKATVIRNNIEKCMTNAMECL